MSEIKTYDASNVTIAGIEISDVQGPAYGAIPVGSGKTSITIDTESVAWDSFAQILGRMKRRTRKVEIPASVRELMDIAVCTPRTDAWMAVEILADLLAIDDTIEDSVQPRTRRRGNREAARWRFQCVTFKWARKRLGFKWRWWGEPSSDDAYLSILRTFHETAYQAVGITRLEPTDPLRLAGQRYSEMPSIRDRIIEAGRRFVAEGAPLYPDTYTFRAGEAFDFDPPHIIRYTGNAPPQLLSGPGARFEHVKMLLDQELITPEQAREILDMPYVRDAGPETVYADYGTAHVTVPPK